MAFTLLASVIPHVYVHLNECTPLALLDGVCSTNKKEGEVENELKCCVFSQEWTKKDVEELLSLLTKPEMQMRESDLSTTDENEDLRVELERSAESSNHIPARERKAGCKNFYWKGFTSC